MFVPWNPKAETVDDLTRRIYESFIKFRTSALPWGDISERAFLNARALPYQFGG